jgi:hypothetical protein
MSFSLAKNGLFNGVIVVEKKPIVKGAIPNQNHRSGLADSANETTQLPYQ